MVNGNPPGPSGDSPAGSARKVFVVGLDGATFDLIKPWGLEGKLPNLSALMKSGTSGPLESTIPPISAAAWASFMTGVNPGKHGIFHFETHVPNTYRSRLVNGADVRARTLWRILSDAGKPVIAMNLAMTYPPEDIEGIIVAGVDAPGPGSQYTHPPDLAQELEQTIGEYVIEPGVVEHCRRGHFQVAYEAIEYALEQRIKAVQHLMRAKPWDLFVVNFRATDNVQHHFWRFMDPSHPTFDHDLAEQYGDRIYRVYRRLDEWLGCLQQQLDEDTVLIVLSDHGAGPAGDTAIYLNRWLSRKGWLTFEGEHRGDILGRVRSRVLSLLWTLIWGHMRKWLGKKTKDALRRLYPKWYNRARTPASYFAIDWEKTRAYSDEYREVVWVNLKGREPHGMVELGEAYETLLADIASSLLELKHPMTGDNVVKRVFRREELYQGGQVEYSPDLVLLLNEDPFISTRLSHTTNSDEPIQKLTKQQIISDRLPSGLHRLMGVLYLTGPHIKAGAEIDNAKIIDLAPTILHLLGLPIPREMDGKVLTGALEYVGEIKYLEEELVGESAGSEYDEDEEALVREKLSGLGYLG